MSSLSSKEFNNWTGAVETFALEDGKIYDHQAQDITWLIEQNKEAQKQSNSVLSNDGTSNLRKIAEIDSTTQLRLLTEFGIDVYNPAHMPKLKQWLNRSENRYFKTVAGRV